MGFCICGANGSNSGSARAFFLLSFSNFMPPKFTMATPQCSCEAQVFDVGHQLGSGSCLFPKMIDVVLVFRMCVVWEGEGVFVLQVPLIQPMNSQTKNFIFDTIKKSVLKPAVGRHPLWHQNTHEVAMFYLNFSSQGFVRRQRPIKTKVFINLLNPLPPPPKISIQISARKQIVHDEKFMVSYTTWNPPCEKSSLPSITKIRFVLINLSAYKT